MPSSANSGLTLYEVLFGKKSNICKLSLFGCSAHLLVPKELRKRNFESNTKPGMFFSFRNDLYKIWINKEKKVVLLKHVSFQEKEFPGQPEARKKVHFTKITDQGSDE